PENLDPADSGQPNVQHDDIRLELAIAAYGVRGRRRPTDHHQRVIAPQQAAVTLAYHRMIVDQQHADPATVGSLHDGAPAMGSEAATLKPAPGSLANVIDPPSADTRSRMPTRPSPGRGAAKSAPAPLSAMRISMHCLESTAGPAAIRICTLVAWA